MIVVDSDDFYLGSANMDWTALTEVKELGVVVEKCELLAQDATKMMIMYWEAAHMTQIPSQWVILFYFVFFKKKKMCALIIYVFFFIKKNLKKKACCS